ncbi:hypothetical protein AK812_SmicGene45388 [Symbiodinium microadriaticum]|uniref:J domain-containing protein n=1 Tax=Symbiodinium microadriaticum TaxID=2951 RepID=A0A1Q9BW89_SYMMI|nr:hypothetical protein AK812_SmicGene45388 [Symbiodinium microadriaticum]
MAGAGRLGELLRRFKLAPGATQAELRKAYYKRAKLLHPDIAGEASQADFRRLRELFWIASLGPLCLMGSEPSSWPCHVDAIPRISTPKSLGSGTAMLLSSEALAVGGPSPGAVEWLHHQGCFNYAAPAEQVEALVEQAFRICRYDAHCATRELQKDKRRESDGAGAGAEAWRQRAEVEELLSWWCRRAWEDRRTKEAAEAVRKAAERLERAQALSSFCRFQATARKAARQACQISGGQQDLLRDWQRCRQSRSRPNETARRLHEARGERGERALDPFGNLAREDCCGDPRCLASLWDFQNLQRRKDYDEASTLLQSARADSPGGIATRADMAQEFD